MALHIIKGDIVKIKTDAVINVANVSLQASGGLSGAIFRAAGETLLRRECENIGSCETGKSVITPGYNLPARYIIHSVCPIWRGGVTGEDLLLRNCYKSALEIVKKYRFSSVGFPIIGAGIYDYPKDRALEIALEELSKYALENDTEIFLVIYNSEDYMIRLELRNNIIEYIREHRFSDPFDVSSISNIEIPELEDVNVGLYRKANMKRIELLKTKMNLTRKYLTRGEVLSIGIALELPVNTIQALLIKGEYEPLGTKTEDLIIKYYLEKNDYNVFNINAGLFAFGFEEL